MTETFGRMSTDWPISGDSLAVRYCGLGKGSNPHAGRGSWRAACPSHGNAVGRVYRKSCTRPDGEDSADPVVIDEPVYEFVRHEPGPDRQEHHRRIFNVQP